MSENDVKLPQASLFTELEEKSLFEEEAPTAEPVKPAEPEPDSLTKEKKLEQLYGAYSKIETLKTTIQNREAEINPAIKNFSRMAMYQQRIIAYSVTCIIFFLIGASLGSIIRKAGLGLPVVIAIVIFIVFYVLNLSMENLAWDGTLNPFLAAWLPNIILTPFGIWMTYKALTDSQLFDAERYKALIKPITQRFSRKKEHQRYQ